MSALCFLRDLKLASSEPDFMSVIVDRNAARSTRDVRPKDLEQLESPRGYHDGTGLGSDRKV